MSNETIIFSMERVSKVIPPQKTIIKNIYLSFFYGAKIGVLGLNGSGKSTLLRIIAGMDKSFTGDVVWSPGYTVGMLEQEPQLDPNKTVLEVVEEAHVRARAEVVHDDCYEPVCSVSHGASFCSRSSAARIAW